MKLNQPSQVLFRLGLVKIYQVSALYEFILRSKFGKAYQAPEVSSSFNPRLVTREIIDKPTFKQLTTQDLPRDSKFLTVKHTVKCGVGRPFISICPLPRTFDA